MKKNISWIGAALWLLFLCLSAYNYYIYTDLRRLTRRARAVLPAEIPSYRVKALENTQSILSL